MAMVMAVDRKKHVWSSMAQFLPGCIQGTLNINARTISSDRYPPAVMRCTKSLMWLFRRVERAAVSGRNNAAAARMEVNRNDERERTKLAVCIA